MRDGARLSLSDGPCRLPVRPRLFVQSAPISSPPALPLAFLRFVCLYFQSRDVAVWRARALVVPDQMGYDALWTAIADVQGTALPSTSSSCCRLLRRMGLYCQDSASLLHLHLRE